MPYSAPSLCTYPGCRELGAHSHRPGYDKARGSAAKRGYDRYHRRWRTVILARDPLCVVCKAKGLIVSSTDADHIIPLSRGGARFSIENGQGLCAFHHGMKTATEDGGFGHPGKR